MAPRFKEQNPNLNFTTHPYLSTFYSHNIDKDLFMNFLKHSLFLSLLFTHCFGMEFFFEKSKKEIITSIFGKLKEKDATQTLNATEFWDMMSMDTLTSEKDTVFSTDSSERACFLAEFIADAQEDDICLVFGHMIKFGQQGQNKFYECITKCTGCNGITPINELIRRIKSENSKIYKLFLQLLDFIKTFDRNRKIHMLTQRELHKTGQQYWYGTEEPMLVAQQENKIYIVNKIADIAFEDTTTDTPGFISRHSDREDKTIAQWSDRRTKSQP